MIFVIHLIVIKIARDVGVSDLEFINGILVFGDKDDLILKNRSALMGLLIDDINTININEHIIDILLFNNTRIAIEY